MPIQAAANKLAEEVAKFGNPPVFPVEVVKEDTVQEAEQTKKAEEKDAAQTIAAKSKGKKSKLAVKGQAGPMRQWKILSMMVPEDEISSFTDPHKWLSYFPPLGISDLKAFGSAIDWRRSFITTAVNPFYDAFIRWQFNRLHGGGKIKSGFRPNIYSAKDRQVCADHDRARSVAQFFTGECRGANLSLSVCLFDCPSVSVCVCSLFLRSGEGAMPQEYTIIKLEVLRPFPAGHPLSSPLLEGKAVYLAPATLRPETCVL